MFMGDHVAKCRQILPTKNVGMRKNRQQRVNPKTSQAIECKWKPTEYQKMKKAGPAHHTNADPAGH
jgi:hypothetical protein